MLTEAVRVPVAAGVNVTLIVQLVPTARLAGQVFVYRNLGELDAADHELAKALALRQRALGNEHPEARSRRGRNKWSC